MVETKQPETLKYFVWDTQERERFLVSESQLGKFKVRRQSDNMILGYGLTLNQIYFLIQGMGYRLKNDPMKPGQVNKSSRPRKTCFPRDYFFDFLEVLFLSWVGCLVFVFFLFASSRRYC